MTPQHSAGFITPKPERNRKLGYIFKEICTQQDLFFLSDFFSWCNLSTVDYLAAAFPYLSCLSFLGLLMLF